MKRILILILLISLAFSGCSLKRTENAPLKKIDDKLHNIGFNYTNNANKFFITEVIPSPSLKNNKLGDPDKQEARIFLPPSYYNSTQKRYPVVYYLHGYGSSFLEIEWYKDAYKSSVSDKKNNEFILVGVNGRNKLDGSFYVNSSVIGNWEDYIVKDIVTFIDNKYRTIANPSSRGISGFSMGGFGAINIGFHHPDVFSCIFAISPGIFDKKDIHRIPKTWNSKMISAYAAAFAPNLNNSYPYADVPSFNNSEQDNKILSKWLNGSGNFDLKVNKYLNNIKQLTGIQIEYGTKDYFDWIPKGCKQLSHILNVKKIQNKLVEFEGNHGDKNQIIVKNHMFPYFSKLLKTEE